MKTLNSRANGLHKHTDSAVQNLNRPSDLIKITETNEEEGATQIAIPKPEPIKPEPSLLGSLMHCLSWCEGIFSINQREWDQIQLEKEIRRQRSMIVKPVLEPSKCLRKMLVLDLSRTLVFFSEQPDKYDFTIKLDSYRKPCRQIYIKKRFGVEYFLSEMNKVYDLVVWSKEDESLVRRVVEEINPDKTVKNLLWGQHCIKLNNIFAKNLNLLGRKLKNVVLFTVIQEIIQSDGQSALVNPDNWVEVNPFEGSERDRELIKNIQFLKFLSDVDDVRPVARHLSRFNRKEIKINPVTGTENPHTDSMQSVFGRPTRPWRRRRCDFLEKTQMDTESKTNQTHYTAMRTQSLQSEASETEDSNKCRVSEL